MKPRRTGGRRRPAAAPSLTPLITVFALALIGSLCAVGAEETYCEGSACYSFIEEKMNWYDAQATCKQRNGKLVSIKASAVQDFLERTAKTQGISSPLWIGATLLNEVDSDNQSVPLWRAVRGFADCNKVKPLSQESVDHSVTAQGCYLEGSDVKSREMTFAVNSSLQELTPKVCLEECVKNNFRFAGVQNGHNCKCGNSFGVYGAADNCTMPCGGDANQSCGGLDAYSIFKTSGLNEDFFLWSHDEPRNVSIGHWCGSLSMYGESSNRRFASLPCSEGHMFLCQLSSDICKGVSEYKFTPSGVCFYFGQENVSFFQARMQCLKRNGDLLVLDSDDKRNEVAKTVKYGYPSVYKDFIWIGLYYKSFYWNDYSMSGDTELCYNKFAAGEPAFQKDCLYLDPSRKYDWYSAQCKEDRYGFICEHALNQPMKSDRQANEDHKNYVNSKPEPEQDFPPVEDDDYQSFEELEKKTKSEKNPGNEFPAASLKERSASASILSPLEIGFIAGVCVALLAGGAFFGIARRRRWPTRHRNRDTSQQMSDANTSTSMPSLSEQGSKGGSTTGSSFTLQADTDLEDTEVEPSHEIQAENDNVASAASSLSSPSSLDSPAVSSFHHRVGTNTEGASRKHSAESHEFDSGATGASRLGSPASGLSIEDTFGIADK